MNFVLPINFNLQIYLWAYITFRYLKSNKEQIDTLKKLIKETSPTPSTAAVYAVKWARMFSKRNSIKPAEKLRPFRGGRAPPAPDFPEFAFLEDRPQTLIILLVRKPRAKQMQATDLRRRHISDSGRILAKRR